VVNGDQQSNVSVSINNASVSFGNFVVGSNTISSSSYSQVNGGFPEIVVYSNENSWHISVAGTHTTMTGTYSLAQPMTIATGTITGDTTGLTGTSSQTTLTTGGLSSFISGGPMNRANISLSLVQPVLPTDRAASDYAMGIIVTYTGTL
jgi:hypothetical protein